jgi:hypothetical protein
VLKGVRQKMPYPEQCVFDVGAFRKPFLRKRGKNRLFSCLLMSTSVCRHAKRWSSSTQGCMRGGSSSRMTVISNTFSAFGKLCRKLRKSLVPSKSFLCPISVERW